MKWKTTLGMALAGVMLTAPAWTHHAAQGIISDDIWLRIDDQVSDMHQEIFDQVMGTMSVNEAPEGGGMFLVTYLETTVAECTDPDGGLEAELLVILSDLSADSKRNQNGEAEGDYNNTFNYTSMPVLYEEDGSACICEGDLDDDVCIIQLWEPIGSVGWHDEGEDPAEEIAAGEPGPNPDGGKKGK